jgi:dihydrofolate reductase
MFALKTALLPFVYYYFKVFSCYGYKQFYLLLEYVKPLPFNETQGFLMMNKPATERVAYLAMSLDGKIARRDGSVDWLDPYPGEAFGYEHFYESVDLILMGRKTYEWILQNGTWPYSNKSVWVYSSHPLEAPPEDVILWNDSLQKMAKQLLLQPPQQKVWICGGAQLVQGLLRERAVTHLELYVIPLLLGEGLSLFGMDLPETRLDLQEVKAVGHGVVKLRYAVSPRSLESQTIQ